MYPEQRLGSKRAAQATSIALHQHTYYNMTTQRHTEYCHLLTEKNTFFQ